MSTQARLAAFIVALAVLFAGGALAGGTIDPGGDGPRPAHGDAAATSEGAHGGAGKEHANVSGPTTRGHGAAQQDSHPVRGLAVAENGLRLVLDDAELRRGRRATLRFRIADARGRTVRDFDVEHERRMHLIVARRDLTGFQHLHPEQAADGSWSVPARLEEAGSYRLFADFSHAGEATTLAGDLRVDGRADLRPLPPPATTAVSDGGHDVRLDAGRARPGRETELRFSITRDGRPVHPEPYLGAGGHLVALREGDLAFLHVHPTERDEGHGTTAGHDDAVGFAATFPTEGRYRLFLQFKVAGRVETVAFTVEVD